MAGNLWRNRRRLNSVLCIVGLWVIGAAVGCAGDEVAESANEAEETNEGGTYNDRLKATAEQFAYFNLLNENLNKSVWEKRGITLRVPLPFELREMPERTARSQTHGPSSELLGVALPGVLGQWEAELPSEDSPHSRKAYLFVMSNHYLLRQHKPSAKAFHQTVVEDVLANLPGLDHLPIESDWLAENWSGYGFPYTYATFPATLAKTGEAANFTMFLMQYGQNERRNEIKVAMLFVVPRAAEFSGSRPDAEPMKLSAQTLRISPEARNSP